MKYFLVFFIVALAAIVSAQQYPAAPTFAAEESDKNPAEMGPVPVEEISREKRGLRHTVYGYPTPYYYGGYNSYYRAPVSYYPYTYGFGKYYYY